MTSQDYERVEHLMLQMTAALALATKGSGDTAKRALERLAQYRIELQRLCDEGVSA